MRFADVTQTRKKPSGRCQLGRELFEAKSQVTNLDKEPMSPKATRHLANVTVTRYRGHDAEISMPSRASSNHFPSVKNRTSPGAKRKRFPRSDGKKFRLHSLVSPQASPYDAEAGHVPQFGATPVAN